MQSQTIEHTCDPVIKPLVEDDPQFEYIDDGVLTDDEDELHNPDPELGWEEYATKYATKVLQEMRQDIAASTPKTSYFVLVERVNDPAAQVFAIVKQIMSEALGRQPDGNFYVQETSPAHLIYSPYGF